MAYEDLIKSIEASADEKNQEIIQNAEREVEAILRESEIESSAIHAQYLEKAKRDLTLESNRQKFLAKQEIKQKISGVITDKLSQTTLPSGRSSLVMHLISLSIIYQVCGLTHHMPHCMNALFVN